MTMMQDFEQQLAGTLSRASERLRDAGIPPLLAGELDKLAIGLHKPCVVAVVGRVKAGKSTFVNALLGEELAKVGVTETTATINVFAYGWAADEGRPVRCYWKDGRETNETYAFVNDLQGFSQATLSRAAEIDYLEYRRPNAYLKDVTLVDTPGLGSVVRQHQDQAAEFLGLSGQLRDPRKLQTTDLRSQADAVIYLVGAIALADDRAMLEEFTQITLGDARRLNAIGVLAQVDQPSTMPIRTHLAGKIARQLEGTLTSVLPVSAALQQALQSLLAYERAGLHKMLESLRRIPPAELDFLLSSDDLYLSADRPSCPLSLAERMSLLGRLDWAVFTAIARVVADPAATEDSVASDLRELAGFDRLEAVLQKQFFSRGQLFHVHRIVTEARRVLSTVRYRHLQDRRKQARDDQLQKERFLEFLRRSNGDSTTRRELETFVTSRLAQRVDLASLLDELDLELDRTFEQLSQYNVDFDLLQRLDSAAEVEPSEVTDAEEWAELKSLLGAAGLGVQDRLAGAPVTAERVAERQQYWQQSYWDPRPLRRAAAERAVVRYGLILDELTWNER